MKAVGQNVLVKPFPSEQVSSGGIFVPEAFRAISNKVLIVSAGQGSVKKPMKFREGDIGFRVKDWGEEVLIEGELHFIMNQEAIIAKQ